MTTYVDFRLGTDVNTDQIPDANADGPGQFSAAQSSDPAGSIRAAGHDGAFHAARSLLSSGIYDNIFLANYATINLNYRSDSRSRCLSGPGIRGRAVCDAHLG